MKEYWGSCRRYIYICTCLCYSYRSIYYIYICLYKCKIIFSGFRAYGIQNQWNAPSPLLSLHGRVVSTQHTCFFLNSPVPSSLHEGQYVVDKLVNVCVGVSL